LCALAPGTKVRNAALRFANGIIGCSSIFWHYRHALTNYWFGSNIDIPFAAYGIKC
jgi:hypothetical protein